MKNLRKKGFGRERKNERVQGSAIASKFRRENYGISGAGKIFRGKWQGSRGWKWGDPASFEGKRVPTAHHPRSKKKNQDW